MLKIVYGTAGTGKTEYVYNQVRDNISKGIKSFILVPDQSTMVSETNMIKKLGVNAQLMVEVISFSRLCNMIFGAMGPLRMKYIDNAGRYMVAQKTLQVLEKKLEYFVHGGSRKGFAGTVSDMVSEMKRYGVTPDVLGEAVDKIENLDLKKKIKDLKLIYETYEELLERDYSDSADNLSICVPKIKDCDMFEGKLYVDGFKSFTPDEYRALTELMKKMDVTVTLCADNPEMPSEPFTNVRYTYNRLCEIAGENGIEKAENVKLQKEYKFEKREALLHLKNNYFKTRKKKFEGENNEVHIMYPKTSYDEVTVLAKLITNLCRTKGYTYNDFLVLTRDSGRYDRVIPAVFEKSGISYFMDRKKPLSSNSFVGMMLSLIEILAFGFSYERLMVIARSSLSGIDADKIDTFENYLLEVNITNKLWYTRDKWNYTPKDRGGRDKYDLDEINETREGLTFPILDLIDSIKGTKTARLISAKIGQWMKDCDLDRQMEKKIETFEKQGNLETAGIYRRSWNTFVTLLTQCTDILGEERLTYAKYYEILSTACREISVAQYPPSQDRVLISEIDRFRPDGEKIVIVLGVTEGVFPKSYITEGLLNDDERMELKALGIELAPTAEYKQQEEEMLIYNVLTAPTEELYLFSPVASRSGESIQKSEIIYNVEKIFGISQEDGEELIEDKELTFDALLTKLSGAEGKEEGLTEDWKEIYSYFANHEDYKKELEDFIRRLNSEETPQILDAENIEGLYGDELRLSVSKVEKYNSCPFSYFLSYGLKAEERKFAGVEVNDKGTIMHETLEKYFAECKEKDVDYSQITREQCYADIERIINQVARDYDQVLYETSVYYKYLVIRMKHITSVTAWEIVKFYANGSFRPYGFEVKIGEDIPRLEVDLEKGKAHVVGSIDRMDMAEIDGQKFVTIVDYKSSVKDLEEEMEEAGVKIQPLIYAGIVRENMENVTIAAMFYMHMNDPLVKEEEIKGDIEKAVAKKVEIKGVVLGDDAVLTGLDRDIADDKKIHRIPTGNKSCLPEEVLDRRIKNAKLKLKETAEKIMEGGIEINPCDVKGFEPCKFCVYKNHCQENKNTVVEN
ncbi:MAG: PD-(D/E)XK nuclease family protein [Clostridia bacterium]|nr:PD-(D/E)XK nuclease family protein [Clostridia bacterium]